MKDVTFKQLTQAGISLIVLIPSLVLIFGNYSDDLKKWAIGVVGIVIGYWLR